MDLRWLDVPELEAVCHSTTRDLSPSRSEAAEV